MTKPTKWYLHPVQTLISDQSSMCAHWVAILAKDQKFLHADSEDWSDWATAQVDPSLRWVHIILLVLSCDSSFYFREWLLGGYLMIEIIFRISP